MKRIYVKPQQQTVTFSPYSLMAASPDPSLPKSEETKGGSSALSKEHDWSSSSLWDEDEEE